MTAEITNIVKLSAEARHAVIYTGNGLLFPSNSLADDIANNDLFIEDPALYNKKWMTYVSKIAKEPNFVHDLISESSATIITECIDGLHNITAPNSKVIELHGNIRRLICPFCCHQEDLSVARISLTEPIRKILQCKFCSIPLRPDIVFFNHPVRNFRTALNEIYKSDLIIVIGSDLTNWPANKLIEKARNSCRIVHIAQPHVRLSQK